MIKSKDTSAYLFAGLAILGWSTISTAFKLALRYQSPVQLLLTASLVSTVVLLFVILIQKKTKLLLPDKFADLMPSLLLGVLNPFLYYAVLLEAYDRLPAQEAQALNYIWAVMTAILSVPILHKKLSLRDLTGILISFGGAVVIATRGRIGSLQFAEPVGVALALVSTLIWAFFWLYNVRDQRDAVVKLFWNFVSGFICILIYALLREQIHYTGIYAILGGIVIGIFEMGITFVLWLLALTKAEHPARITNLIFITPFLSLLIISRILGESIAVSTLAGLALIISGILWQQKKGGGN
jgi:drug/metabolite transporter (DMT)-like permease